ncbi:MAG: adenylate/guanylate cyclase domain-containing protein, partial [Mycobacterium sp.]
MALRERSVCVPEVALSNRVPARTQHYAESVASRMRVLKIAAWIGAFVSAAFGIWQLTWDGGWHLGIVNLGTAVIFLLIPLLGRFSELVAPLTFFFVAYASLFVVCWHIGTGTGLQFYFLVAASLVVLVLGIERIVLGSILVVLGVAGVIALEIFVPNDRGLQPAWTLTVGFVSSIVSSAVIAVATVWYTLREIQRAEAAMEAEYQRSEALLANILPATIAQRLKDPSRNIIADKYD